MPVEQLRPILLIGLAVVGFLLWQEWQQDFGPGAQRDPAPAVRDAPASRDVPAGGQSTPSPRRETADDLPAAAGASSSSDQPAPAVSNAAVDELVEVRTDVLTVRIDPLGGTLRQVLLPRYPATIDDPGRPFVLMDDRPGLFYVAESGLVGASGPNHHDLLTPERNDYELGPGSNRLEVRFHWEDENGIRIAKVFEFTRDSYEVAVRHEVENASSLPWTGQAYGQYRRVPPADSGGLGDVTSYTYTGAVISSPDKPYEKIDFDDMLSENLDREIRDGWFAMIQHYFASAWIPERSVAVRYYTKALEGGEFLAGLVGPPVTVAPGDEWRHEPQALSWPQGPGSARGGGTRAQAHRGLRLAVLHRAAPSTSP